MGLKLTIRACCDSRGGSRYVMGVCEAFDRVPGCSSKVRHRGQRGMKKDLSASNPSMNLYRAELKL